jgi:hypothetical protein
LLCFALFSKERGLSCSLNQKEKERERTWPVRLCETSFPFSFPFFLFFVFAFGCVVQQQLLHLPPSSLSPFFFFSLFLPYFTSLRSSKSHGIVPAKRQPLPSPELVGPRHALGKLEHVPSRNRYRLVRLHSLCLVSKAIQTIKTSLDGGKAISVHFFLVFFFSSSLT